jgi:hypothetical protein
MRRQWAFTILGSIMLSLGVARLIWPPEPKVSLLRAPTALQAEDPAGNASRPVTLAIYDIRDIVDALLAQPDYGSLPSTKEEAVDQVCLILEEHLNLSDQSSFLLKGKHIGTNVLLMETPQQHQRAEELLQAIRRAHDLQWAWKAK